MRTMLNLAIVGAGSLLLLASAAFAEKRGSCDESFEAPFRSGSELRLDLRAGDINISGTDAANGACQMLRARIPTAQQDVIGHLRREPARRAASVSKVDPTMKFGWISKYRGKRI